ncbi:MAG: tRNA dihydrouridine(20/20a) synthase DusA [Gammaproteobacteria bacterium]|nr:tRNA dihydrouridine(20/20a) synthase DusA [Gammaproteobacteria bacterium]
MKNSTNYSRIAVAPMMDWTDRHCRYFMRLLSPGVRLYTEMVTTAALCHGDAATLLQFDPSEHPLALQLGGSDPATMARAAKMGADAGYDEININIGCPSDRVQSGAFGACLMAKPKLVGDCVAAARDAVDIPVTVKTRIGIDDHDSFEFLQDFVATVAASGCELFVVHARKAILSGLSPKDNRRIPPLNYDRVYEIKRAFPDLTIVLNGGITTIEQCRRQLEMLDGVMIGRKAYQQPWFLFELEQAMREKDTVRQVEREQIIEQMYPYIEQQLCAGVPLKRITRHLFGLFAGQAGARAWRRYLSEHAHQSGAGIEVLQRALEQLPRAA